MSNAAVPVQPTNRFWACAILFFAALACGLACAQDVSPLKPNEAIEIPGGSLTVLALDIKRGEGTAVTMRMRALAGPKGSLSLDSATFRLLAAGVPRVPATGIYLTVQVDSAMDFDLGFKIPDRTDDLVLQARFGDVVIKRRLQKR
jgi:hypothetical protein